MAVFEVEAETWDRLDYRLLQDGPVNLYWRRSYLDEDTAWLRANGYRTERFDTSAWTDENVMHDDLKTRLGFPDYYGKNLNALDDVLSDPDEFDMPAEGGLVLVFLGYDAFDCRLPDVADAVLDVITDASRVQLLFGKRLIALVQSDDPRIAYRSLGGRPAYWNHREFFDSSRGL
jgi:RNAse (barnase) inhibitor barstar